MRLALVIGSAYEKNTQLSPVPSAVLDCELFARRLGAPEVDFRVLYLPAERGLAERLEQRLLAQTESIDELFVYFSGYCVLSAERGPALLLDGERIGTFSLARLRKLLEKFASASCVLVDAAAVVDAGQSLDAVVASVGDALTEGSASVCALVAARNSNEPDSFGGSAFTGLVLMVLDWLLASRDAEQAIDVAWLFSGLRADVPLWDAIPAAALFPDAPAFVLVPPATGPVSVASSLPPPVELPTAPRHSIPPPPPARGASSSPPLPAALAGRGMPSFPPPVPGAISSAPPTPVVSSPRFGISSAPPTPVMPPPTPVMPPPTPVVAASAAALVSASPTPVAPPFVAPPMPRPARNGAEASPERIAPPPSPPPERPRRAAAPAGRVNLDDLDSLLGIGAPATDADEPAPDSVTPVRRDEEALPSFADEPSTAVSAQDAALPLPSFGGSTSAADELFEAGEYERAAVEYEAAFILLDDPRERAGALARWARALARLERGDEARARAADARALDPAHPDVVAVRAELAEATGDHTEVLGAAEAWLAIAPNEPHALRLVAAAAEALGDARKALAARCRLARYAEGTAEEKAQALFDASELAERELEDRVLALDLAAEALALVPGAAHVAARVGALVEAYGSPRQLFAHYERALVEARDPEAIADLAAKLDRLASAAGEPARAARCLERLIALRPDDLALRDRLIELYAAGAARAHALAHCRAAARLAPHRAATYRRAQTLLEAEGALDGAWNAASVLDSLGEADINEALLASQHRPEGLLAARGTLSDEDFRVALLGPDGDRDLLELVAALGDTAVRVGVGFAKHKERYFEPDPATLQDVEKSTTMLAKTLGWTARLLGSAPPALYVLPELTAGLDVAVTEEPSALASRTLGSGLGLGELAFLWGRQLPRFRRELRALTYFRTEEELGALALAALAVAGAPGFELRELEGDVKRLYAALRRELRGPELERVERAARAVPAAEVYERVRRVLFAVELVGVRAGLAACGDVGVAAELSRRFPLPGFLGVEDQVGELYAFAISEEYAALRQRIGVIVASPSPLGGG